jgi:transcriptional regulator with XRE-family HTH domain
LPVDLSTDNFTIIPILGSVKRKILNLGNFLKNSSFSTRLRNLRESLGLTQAEFAEKLGIPRTSLFNYEKGVSVPTGDFIYTLGTNLRVNFDWFFTGEGEMFLPASPDVNNFSQQSMESSSCDVRIRSIEFRLTSIEALLQEIKAMLDIKK